MQIIQNSEICNDPWVMLMKWNFIVRNEARFTLRARLLRDKTEQRLFDDVYRSILLLYIYLLTIRRFKREFRIIVQ